MKKYRILAGVRPYPGRVLVVPAKNEYLGYVEGYVQLGKRSPPGARRYERSEITLAEDEG